MKEESEFEKAIRDAIDQQSRQIPAWNKRGCKDGCNCIEVAEAKNNGNPVKDYACLLPADFKESFSKMAANARAQLSISTNDIILKIRAIENKNNQSISFVLHEDGSGCFEDFWSETPVVKFENLNELQSILITEQ